MNSFVKTFLLFALPVLVTGISVEVLIRHIPNSYKYKKTYLDKNSRQIRFLCLGNSHMYFGIDPEYIRMNSFNVANVSQSLDLDRAIFEKYNDKWDSLRYILLPADYFTLYRKFENIDELWRLKNYNIYYGIHIGNNLAYNSEVLTTKLAINLNRIYAYYLKNNYTPECSALGQGSANKFKNGIDLEESGISAAKRHSSTDEDAPYFNENIENIKAIIAFAKVKNIRVILLTSPAYKTYVQNLNKKQLSSSIEAFTAIANSSANVTYVNLLSDTSFTKDDFYDADHLCETGAKKISLKLDSLLTTIK